MTAQVTPSLQLFLCTSFGRLCYVLRDYWERHCAVKNNDVGLGLFVQSLYNLSILHVLLSLNLVSVGFGTAVPTTDPCTYLENMVTKYTTEESVVTLANLTERL